MQAEINFESTVYYPVGHTSNCRPTAAAQTH